MHPHDSPADANACRAWRWLHHPAGFVLLRPPDWPCRIDGPGSFAVSDPLGTAAAMVRARIVPEALDLDEWLRAHYAATEPGLQNVRVVCLRTRGRWLARTVLDYGSLVRPGRATVLVLRERHVATVFVAAAALGGFAERWCELVRILSSVRFTSEPAPGREAPALQLRCPITRRFFAVQAAERHYVPGEDQPAAGPGAGRALKLASAMRIGLAADTTAGLAS